jgi:hypothetical protein
MRFQYDPSLDAVHASFTDCVLSTPKDVERWEREVKARLATFGRKVDLLIDMSGLIVKPAVSTLFGEARARVLRMYANRSFRYGADRSTRISVFTSSVIHQIDANVFATREEAIEALIQSRQREAH